MNDLSYPLWSTGAEPALLASREHDTGEWIFPAVPDSSPLAGRYETVPVAPIGECYSFTVIHPGAKSGEPPYALGYVDFAGPVRIFGRLRGGVSGDRRPVIGERYVARPDEQFGYAFEAIDAAR